MFEKASTIVVIRYPLLRVVTALGVLQQNAQLQPGPLIFAYPGEF